MKRPNSQRLKELMDISPMFSVENIELRDLKYVLFSATHFEV